MMFRLLTLFLMLIIPVAGLTTSLPEALLHDLDPLEGTVILATPEQTLIDRDAQNGVAEGDIFAVLVNGAPIIHPTTGAILATPQSVGSWLRVARLRSGYSETTPLVTTDAAKVGARVRRFSEVEALFLDPQGSHAALYPILQSSLPQLRWLGYFTTPPALPQTGRTPRLILTADSGILELRESSSGLLRRYPLPASPPAVASVPPGAVAAPPPASTFWNAQTGSGIVRGLEIADLDGDKRNETITATLHGIEIGRYQGKDYQKLATCDLGLSRSILGVDAFDSDGDGRMELWITANRDSDLDSAVLHWDGQETIKPVVEHLNWWLRCLNLPSSGRILLAQRMGETDFTGAIMRIALRDGKIVTTPANLPNGIPLYGLAILDSETGPLTVRLTADDRLLMANAAGERIIDSDGIFGGSEAFIARPDPRRSGIDADTRNVYPPPRFETINGRYLLAPANLGSRTFARQREFKQSRLDLLSWDGAMLRPLVTGRIENGYLVDYRYADLDNDGSKEIVSLFITARPGLTGKGRYLIVVNETVLPE